LILFLFFIAALQGAGAAPEPIFPPKIAAMQPPKRQKMEAI
jgi:hypothetical protein